MQFKQGSTSVITILMVDSTDHITGKTGLTLTVKISKAGATGVSPTGTVAQVDSTNMPGLYKLTMSATDSDTLGFLDIYATAAGADPSNTRVEITAVDPSTPNTYGATVAAVATAVWTDTTTGDFTVIGSPGKTLMTAATLDEVAGAILITPVNKINTGGTGGVVLDAAGLDGITVDGINARQALAVLGALVGKRSGLPNGPLVFKGLDGSTTRLSVTYGLDNNTIIWTLTPPA